MSSKSFSAACNANFTVILANGTFPTSPRALEYLYSADMLVCCDGAAQNAVLYGRTPDYIVGDLDSLSGELQTRFSDRIVRVSEQETNDLTKAFRFCRARNWNNLVILGATGKREDHALGNLARFVEFAKETHEIQLVTDDGVFKVATAPGAFRSQPGQQVSIFSLHPDQRVSSRGLKYPLNNLRLDSWYVATLNEALGKEFELAFDAELSPLLLFFADLKESERFA